MARIGPGSPHPAPTTITPRDTGRSGPASTRVRSHSSSGGRPPATTVCQGAPSLRPGVTPPPAAASPSSGSRKGRFRWTGPGPAGPDRDSASDRAASDRHDVRVVATGTPGSTNHRTARP
jgi:hypothetical protein